MSFATAVKSSFKSALPFPKNHVYDSEDDEKLGKKQQVSKIVTKSTHIPPYGQRKGWVPRTQEDFADGGAYPEIHVVQYPLNMGLKSAKESNALPLQLSADGKIKYDAIVKQGQKDKVIYHKLSDLLPSETLNEDDPELQKPDEEEVGKTTEETRAALEALTKTKISAALPVRHAEKPAPAQYIRYTPSQQGQEFNSGATQRIIRMVEVQKDPLEPPKFKINKKIPQAPPSPPPPIMHSPTRKVSVKEQQEWRIPPCISNWKNARGYTIPLDKRLAADGRGLQQTHINENFAKLAEALYIADRKAREAVETRAQMEKKVAQNEKEKKEEHLRALAQKAREERAGIRVGNITDEDEELKERQQIRYERHKERQRERNIQRAAPEKRSKLERQRERDISEQIALGLANPRVNSTEVQFDQRLFNQSKGVGAGFGDEDDYAVYDKPWRSQNAIAQNIYRPTRGNEDKDVYGDDLDAIASTSRFVPDKEFSGTDRTLKRDGPVAFEKHEEEDPFGLDKFLTEAKKASKRPEIEANYENRSSYKKRKE
ncbi:SNW domain-containing protein 1-like protein [Dinothrombium tinctorium]|uniref:SNW domain-containing protein 1-like protein n=1 Tax=Dinothrombium tinctorium TaxID=1965070 RepID=A0A443QEA7_9ACAR|nr:SNW domain-containing protein 1-like protein [Dinothrombium tinctorium]